MTGSGQKPTAPLWLVGPLIPWLVTAQRRGDVVGLGWQNVRRDILVLRQEKNDQPLLTPMH